MKFTLKRGLFRLATAIVVVAACLPIAEEFVLGIMCILACAGWLVFWIAGGFFDM
ncbi:MAG: hypothetical protein PHY02_00010 [Phycisphaerae bacterium]|nr:hypothetical protein [Phycisphaerae bacterium]